MNVCAVNNVASILNKSKENAVERQLWFGNFNKHLSETDRVNRPKKNNK